MVLILQTINSRDVTVQPEYSSNKLCNWYQVVYNEIICSCTCISLFDRYNTMSFQYIFNTKIPGLSNGCGNGPESVWNFKLFFSKWPPHLGRKSAIVGFHNRRPIRRYMRRPLRRKFSGGRRILRPRYYVFDKVIEDLVKVKRNILQWKRDLLDKFFGKNEPKRKPSSIDRDSFY